MQEISNIDSSRNSEARHLTDEPLDLRSTEKRQREKATTSVGKNRSLNYEASEFIPANIQSIWLDRQAIHEDWPTVVPVQYRLRERIVTETTRGQHPEEAQSKLQHGIQKLPRLAACAAGNTAEAKLHRYRNLWKK